MFPEAHLQYLSRCVTQSRFDFAILSDFERFSTEHDEFSPEKDLYQLKAHFLLSSLLKFHLICDKGSRINYVLNLASDFYRVTGPLFSGLSQCQKLDRS